MQAKAALMELLVEFEQAKELEQQPQMVCPMEAKPSAENLQEVFLLEHWTSSGGLPSGIWPGKEGRGSRL